MSRKKDGRKGHELTEALIGTYLLSLAETGRTIPKLVFRAWLRQQELDINLSPDGYTDSRDFALDYQSVRFLKKYPFGLTTKETRKSLAIQKFLDCERVCGETNVRFCNLNRVAPPDILANLERARSIVHSILGSFSWDKAVSYCGFGPGASIGITKRQAHVVNKIGKENPTVTGECLALLRAYHAWAPRSKVHFERPSVVRGSKVTTVPKDAKVDRIIATEPLWNMFFQKGIGGLIRHRLRTVGLDLNNQAEKNREFARIGSIYGTYATLDLKSASDSIGLELVRYLVPHDWFEALSITRCKETDIDGTSVFLRKISSNGNGNTFELESLIFLALAQSVSPANARSVNVDVATFGDDIICRPEVARNLSALLCFCGFQINPEKSFIAGPFRESCGGHFFEGDDVTPYQLDKRVTSPHTAYWFLNSVRRFASRLGKFLYCDACVLEPYQLAVRSLSPRLRRIRIPPGCGDDGIMSCFDEVHPTPYFDKKYGAVTGFRYKAWARSPVKIEHEEEKGLSAVLYRLKDRCEPFPTDKENRLRWRKPLRVSDDIQRVRDEEVSFRLRIETRITHQQWGWLGPWA